LKPSAVLKKPLFENSIVMKKLIFILGILFVIITAFAPASFKSGIQGTLEPADGAKRIVGISGIDSVSAVPLGGRFALEVNPGTWKIYVEASAPYKSVVLENVVVREDQVTDVGVVKLNN
jgi:hypothetical protein